MNRYPGIRPFRSDERALFFGRRDDTERLLRLIRLEKIVILYGKSGYGKSSLLQAGVCPQLLDAGDLPFKEIRFGPYTSASFLQPAKMLTLSVGLSVYEIEDMSSGLGQAVRVMRDSFTDDGSLWLTLKLRQLATGNHRFLLLFDQFEELFTYPSEQVLEFKRQLAEALFTLVPDRFGRALAKNPGALTADEQAAFYTPLDFKVVFSIRADRMSQLNTLKDYLPNLLQHAYLLDALDEHQATEAITAPALLPSGEDFDTPPFRYDPAALRLIFKELRDAETGKIETSALQIVCRHVEDSIVRDYVGPIPVTIGPTGLEDIKSIFRQFYDHTIATLPEAQQSIAHHLVEDLLIKEGVRLPFAEQALLAEPGVTPILLQALADASLLRVERDEQGRMLYEVGHDTLVGPISEAAKVRRELEAKEREKRAEAEQREILRQEAERQAEERRKITNARRRNILISIGALLLLAFAFWKSQQADKAQTAADQAKVEAAKMTALAEQKDTLAKINATKADVALKTAEEKTEEAQRNFDEAKRQTGIASRQTQRAAEALRQAAVEREKAESAAVTIIENLLQNGSEAIQALDYEQARGILGQAETLVKGRPKESPLTVWRTAVAQELMEVAFFYTQIHQHFTAAKILVRVNDLLSGAPLPDLVKIQDNGHPGDRAMLEKIMEKLAPHDFHSLQQRYLLSFVKVPSGAFFMGSDSSCTNCGDDEKPSHEVHLKHYQLGSTEVTMWQYNLYCQTTGHNIANHHEKSWGKIRGDDPVIYVSWYDAVQYANWLSVQQGLETVYVIDSLQQDTSNLSQYDDLKWKVIPNLKANGYRLPTESEWEYAARNAGRDHFQYAGGDTLDNVGWFAVISDRTQPTGRKRANQLGLYDMSGNVWEWCWDWYAPYAAETSNDPQGPDRGDYRVFRGGSWYFIAEYCRSARRNYYRPTNRYSNIGFRLARSF